MESSGLQGMELLKFEKILLSDVVLSTEIV